MNRAMLCQVVIMACLGSACGRAAEGIPTPWNAEIQQLRNFGDLPVATTSPTFFYFDIQLNNPAPTHKVVPKDSRSIKSNYVGATPPRLPRSEAFDLQPFRRVHLLDGDDQSLWMSRGQARANVQPEWVRIDLPFEQPIERIVLRPMDNELDGWPATLAVEVSQDSYEWTTLPDGQMDNDANNAKICTYAVRGKQIKQIRVTGQDLALVNLSTSVDNTCLGHGFCLRGVDVINDAGENVALISRGAGVTVSSTNYGYGDKRSIQDMLWPIHYDLGVKHLKIAYWDSTLNWHYVETKKGVYQIDPHTDATITEATRNGCNIYLTLAYGNWLYADGVDDGSNAERWRFWQFPFQKPPVPMTDEQIEAYCNFCRFMVRHFEGRISYFEIWNEQNIPYSWPPNQVESFCRLVKAASRAIKETNPHAKVMLGGVCFCDVPYFESMFRQGVAECVDVICWHPYQWEVPPEESYRLPSLVAGEKPYASYRERVRAIQDLAVRYGFKGHEYHANETTWVAPYPAPDFGVPGGPVSEMVKAKYVARTIALHSDLGIPVYFNETWNTGIVYWDVSLLRATQSADPSSPVWPQPAYYALRTMATITDGAHPTDIAMRVEGLDKPFDTCRLQRDDGSLLLGVWLTQPAVDNCRAQFARIVIPRSGVKEIVAIDTINGTEQALRFESAGYETVVPDICVADFPVMLSVR